MDPDRVDRENAAWRDSMISLHDTSHGSGYWRELLSATIAETITYPRWTAVDLADLAVPVLAVQGTDDSVNVPGRHAETIAEWIPRGQVWLAEGRDHSVHWEAPDDFIERVTEFFAAAPG